MKKKAYLILIIILILTDQIVKLSIVNNGENFELIKGIINISYIQNTGGAFGIANGNIYIIIAINILIIISILIFMIKKYSRLNKIENVGITLVIAGGISNLIDRIFRGYVVDYIDINPLFKYPIFNIADITIVIRNIYTNYIFNLFHNKTGAK